MLALLGIAALLAAVNADFLSAANKAPNSWAYVGVVECNIGRKADGSHTLTAKANGKEYIIFKQKNNDGTVSEACPDE